MSVQRRTTFLIVVLAMSAGFGLIGFLWVITGMSMESPRHCISGSIDESQRLAKELNSSRTPFGVFEVWDVCYRGQSAYVEARPSADRDFLIEWAKNNWTCTQVGVDDPDDGRTDQCTFENAIFEMWISPNDPYVSNVEVVVHPIF